MKLRSKIIMLINRFKPISQPKGIAVDTNVHKVTRQVKRNAKILVCGKWIGVLEHIDNCAKLLPPMFVENSKVNVDHKGCLKLMYMEYGIDGINKYLKHVRKSYKKTAKPKNIISKPC